MSEQPRINAYEFGRIEIDGQTYTSDLIILPTGVRSNWWRAEGHSLRSEDLAVVVQARPKMLVVGQGAQGRMSVPAGTLAHLEQAGIEVVCVSTAQAVQIYNERCQRGELVAAALHLTC
jgi:hypothetical protein